MVRIWLVDLHAEVLAGEKSPGTEQLYVVTAGWIIAGLGELRLRELTVGRVDGFITATGLQHGAGAAKRGENCTEWGAGAGSSPHAIRTNPVRDTARIKHGEKKTAVALDLAQVYDLRVKLAADQKARDWDLLDFVDMMLATGKRIGENSAITWDALDLEAGTVEIRGIVIRVKGHGLQIKPKPKSKAGHRTLRLPSWAVKMLHRRQTEAVPNEWRVVFTSPTGLLRDPSNTQTDLRDVFRRIGYLWVTSHVFRKTAATLLDEAGSTARVLEIIGQPDAALIVSREGRGSE